MFQALMYHTSYIIHYVYECGYLTLRKQTSEAVILINEMPPNRRVTSYCVSVHVAHDYNNDNV